MNKKGNVKKKNPLLGSSFPLNNQKTWQCSLWWFHLGFSIFAAIPSWICSWVVIAGSPPRFSSPTYTPFPKNITPAQWIKPRVDYLALCDYIFACLLPSLFCFSDLLKNFSKSIFSLIMPQIPVACPFPW